MVKTIRNKKTSQRGFTLIEMLVAVAIFALFFTISATSLVNVVKLEQKTNVLRQTQQDARYILETISREARSANGEINSGGDRVWPAYSFDDPNYTRLTITSTDTVAGEVTQKEYSLNVNTIEVIKKTKNITDSTYTSEPLTALNNPDNIKITGFSLVGSIPRLPDLSIPPKLVIDLKAESGKGKDFVKEEYRAYIEFKTSVSPRNY